MTTAKPSPASRSAIAAPMPREPPVTIATFLPALDIAFSVVPGRCLRPTREDLPLLGRKIISRRPVSLFCCAEQSSRGGEIEPARDPYRLQERLIMADDEQRAVISPEARFDGFNGLEVQMIGRLVQDQKRSE